MVFLESKNLSWISIFTSYIKDIPKLLEKNIELLVKTIIKMFDASLAWIKKYGKGNIFYSSPAHNAQSFSNPQLLQFFLDGLQFVVGDVKCDTSPMGN